MRTMRRTMLGVALAAGCNFDGVGLGSAGTSATSESSSSAETGATGTTAATTGETGAACAPGEVQACGCPAGEGTQECAGGVFGPCECAAPTTGPEETSTGETSTGEVSSSSGGVMCTERDAEPNDAADGAIGWPQSTCKAGYKKMVGTLATADDVDWHAYVGQESSPCKSERTNAKHRLRAAAAATLCVVPTCQSGTQALIDCVHGEANADETGCCAAGTDIEVQARIDCDDAGSEDVDMLVAVSQAAADCVDYEINYLYDK